MKGFYFKSNSDCEYFYDDRTGFIHPMYNEVEKNQYEDKYHDFIQMCNYQVKEEVTVDKVKMHLYKEANGFRQLILEAASGCNLRCKYCIYGEHYPTFKSYDNEFLSFDTAKKAVDYYMENFQRIHKVNPTRHANIGFYGGEPLLNFKVIKQIVEYANKQYGNIFYHITTNGLLLDQEVQDYLAENEFSIIVSLDGYKENHDRNRVTHNGEGSFDLIMKHIREFRKRYPEYNKFGISLCYDFKSEIHKIEKFIEEEELFVTKLSMVESHNTTYYNQFTTEEINKFFENKNRYEDKFHEVCSNNTIDKGSFLYTYLGVDYSEFAFHSVYKESKPGIIPCAGSCVPGEKIYVTIDGKIHICEKINSNFAIGDVENGIDFNKVIDIINSYRNVFVNRCDACGVSRFCNFCFAQCCEDESFEKQVKECNLLKDNIKHRMSNYVSLLEKNPGIFDDITVDYYDQIMQKVGGCFDF